MNNTATPIDNYFDKLYDLSYVSIFIDNSEDIDLIEKNKNDKVTLEDYVRNVMVKNRHFIVEHNFNNMSHEDKEKLIHDTVNNINSGKYKYTCIAVSYNIMKISDGISGHPLYKMGIRYDRWGEFLP